MNMVRYSNDVNVYVESKSPMHERKLPVVAKAMGIYRHAGVVRNLDDSIVPTITETSLKDDYNEALRLLEGYIVNVYRILGAKGGLTKDEWEHMKSSVSKGNYRFPDINQALGTSMKWQIDDKSAETFLKTTLKAHGIDVKLVAPSGGKFLYEDENTFLKKMASDFAVNMDFEQIEKRIDSADYSKTKKRLHYITIYDFLKFHLGLNNVPSKEDFINQLDICKDKASADIIAVKTLVRNISGDFWAEYEKYREFKMVQVLARWYGKSVVRCLSGEAYKYFSENISEQMLSQALRYLKVHTAFLDTKRSKASTSGSDAFFEFRIEKLNGDVYVLVSENNHATEFVQTSKKSKLTSPNSLKLQNLTYGKTYCVTLWEVMGSDDVVKLGNLPSVTPGIKWPVVKKMIKTPADNKMGFSMVVEGGEGNLSYVACVKKGNATITSLKNGKQVPMTAESGGFGFKVGNLQYDETYTFCVFVLLDGGKYCSKLVAEFQHIPKKIQLFNIVRTTDMGIVSKQMCLDFEERGWPELFKGGVIRFACRTDRFPEGPEDRQPGYTICDISENDYKNGVFKLILEKFSFDTTLYICGWLSNGTVKNQLVVRNAFYDIWYSVKKNVLHFDMIINNKVSDLTLPKLRFYGYDKKDNLVIADENVVVGSDRTWVFTPNGKVKSVMLEASDPMDRRVYWFRSYKTTKRGKSKI